MSPDDISLGSLVIYFRTLIGLQLRDAKPETVESVRQVFKTDTLGGGTTFVEKEGAPGFVGRGPAKSGKPESNTSQKLQVLDLYPKVRQFQSGNWPGCYSLAD